jgi:hypothetical protein
MDEAGDTGYKRGSSHYLIVVAIVCDSIVPLRKIVERTRDTLTKRMRQVSELKASQIPDNIVLRMLHQLAALDVEVYVTVLDKDVVKRPADAEEWYRNTFSECVSRVLARHPKLIATMDRRYSKSSHHEKLIRAIMERVEGRGASFTLYVENSEHEKAMQLADAVAWSILQKYTYEDIRFYRAIETRIKEEIVVVK